MAHLLDERSELRQLVLVIGRWVALILLALCPSVVCTVTVWPGEALHPRRHQLRVFERRSRRRPRFW